MTEGTIDAKAYAKANMTDSITALGMRLAMYEAVVAWKDLPAAEQTKEKAISLIEEKSRSNDLLQSAGTQEIVARFYGDIARNNDSVGFLNAIDAGSVEEIKQGIIEKGKDPSAFSLAWDAAMGSPVINAANTFSKASHEHLHMGTLTETFLNDLKNKPELTQGATITPKGLSAEQARLVAYYDNTFRQLDSLDASIFQNPEVQHLIAPPSKDALNALGMEASKGAAFDESKIPEVIQKINAAAFPKKPEDYQGLAAPQAANDVSSNPLMAFLESLMPMLTMLTGSNPTEHNPGELLSRPPVMLADAKGPAKTGTALG